MDSLKTLNLGLIKPESFFNGNITKSIEGFKYFIQKPENQKKVVIACKNRIIFEGFKNIFKEYNINFTVINSFEDIESLAQECIGLCVYEVDYGFETANLIFLADSLIIGKNFFTTKQKKQVNVSKVKVFTNEFDKGDLIVHKEFGIGLFEGVFVLEHAGIKYDSVKIIYQNNDVLYVPIYNINQITKYGNEAMEEEKIKLLDKLGSNSFKIRKEKVKAKIFQIAEKLMQVAAKRSAKKAGIFSPISGLYDEFENSFLYKLTQDQELAINDVIEDLSSGKPMERLICGDVGFGKTEVAMRASFLVVCGRLVMGHEFGQVAIVVPTTILARQHYNNFTERFKGVDVKIKELSRSVSAKERKEVFKQIEEGKVDIVIGTHAIFSESIKFNNLQLLIIDEEQHFGVKQKEKLKEGREEVHFLSLSATPIPRTLQMSLSGIKDISLITTPPFDRLLPKTFLMPYDIITLSNAIIREKSRGGRVFFVAPRISDLESQKAKLEAVLPDVKFAITHGRMRPNQIEDIMLGFYEGKIDVLVTTSIIESGIDISFANTIIIYRAEMFGLAGLYQLRGRVGRSSIQSYAYFIVQEERMMQNTTSRNRLQTLVNLKSLGGGFKVAGADMDIRGAGNLVGEEQSGKINDVGVELYQEMLEEAISKLKYNTQVEEDEEFTPEIKIGMGVMIPEEYVPDFNIRLELYRRISAVSSKEELILLNEEIEDRFGKLPFETQNLVSVIELKMRCKQLGILKLEVGPKGVVVEPKPESFKKAAELIYFMQKNPKICKISHEGSKITFFDAGVDPLKKADTILNTIASL